MFDNADNAKRFAALGQSPFMTLPTMPRVEMPAPTVEISETELMVWADDGGPVRD